MAATCSWGHMMLQNYLCNVSHLFWILALFFSSRQISQSSKTIWGAHQKDNTERQACTLAFAHQSHAKYGLAILRIWWILMKSRGSKRLQSECVAVAVIISMFKCKINHSIVQKYVILIILLIVSWRGMRSSEELAWHLENRRKSPSISAQ